ncbi:hypothetical protein TrVGV298_011445 [Trichoderma virens]|nr:hypothetical protein TrVGV298_011445 [Trichoderma virens]
MAGSVVAPPSTAIFFVTDVARPSALQQTNGPLHDALCTSIQTSTTASVVKLRTVAVTVHDQQPTARSAKSPSNAAVAGSVLQGSPTRYLALCLCTFPYQIMDHGTLHGILPRRTYAHHTCFAAFISRCTVYRRGSAPASGPLLLQIASRGPPPDFEAYDTHPGMYKYSMWHLLIWARLPSQRWWKLWAWDLGYEAARLCEMDPSKGPRGVLVCWHGEQARLPVPSTEYRYIENYAQAI